MRSVLKACPKIFTKDYAIIQANFTFLSQVVKLTHTDIAAYPPILFAPLVLLKSRYSYLKHLDKLQLDPTKPNFVTLKCLNEPDDAVFCRRTARTTLDEYKKFLKTL